jgi:hypothetical protein
MFEASLQTTTRFSTNLGDWPLPIIGGRLLIANNPYQGIFCSRDQKTLKNTFTTGFSVRS